jgi:hypothetical protein
MSAVPDQECMTSSILKTNVLALSWNRNTKLSTPLMVSSRTTDMEALPSVSMPSFPVYSKVSPTAKG